MNKDEQHLEEMSDLLPEEFYDTGEVLKFGATKYGKHNWLKREAHFNFKDNCSSMFRHLAKHTAGEELDEESGLDHLLHIACRAMMAYTRKRRNLDESNTDQARKPHRSGA